MDDVQNNVQDNVQGTRKYVKRGRKKRFARSKKTIIAVGITTIVLVVATYAWFVGITRVKVDKFVVDVSVAEGLSLSLDGKHWLETVTVSKGVIEGRETYETDDGDKLLIDPTDSTSSSGEYPSTKGNVNHWASAGNTLDSGNNLVSTGLEPVSSAGELIYDSSDPTDVKNSQVRFFGKTTMTSEAEGYKFTAGDITSPTAKGYIAFDLFLRNSAGSSYNSNYVAAEDEEVFLTKASDAYYDTSGSSVGEGIENSLRVGFFSLGRVSSSTDSTDTIQGISCAGGTGVTPLCNIIPSGQSAPERGYNWNIWEPNDTAHKTSAIVRFNGACIKRSNVGVYATGNDKNCTQLSNPGYVNTYAVKAPILLSDSTDSNIYDGHNGYPNSTHLSAAMETLTNTENRIELNRNSLLHVAPKSITKIRVYIWLEGQDIDNFDLAAQYQTLKISFGLTKERYDSTNVPTPSSSSSPSSEATTETTTEPTTSTEP